MELRDITPPTTTHPNSFLVCSFWFLQHEQGELCITWVHTAWCCDIDFNQCLSFCRSVSVSRILVLLLLWVSLKAVWTGSLQREVIVQKAFWISLLFIPLRHSLPILWIVPHNCANLPGVQFFCVLTVPFLMHELYQIHIFNLKLHDMCGLSGLFWFTLNFWWTIHPPMVNLPPHHLEFDWMSYCEENDWRTT